MKLFFLISLLPLLATAEVLPKETKLALQVAELEMQLSQTRYENSQLSQKLLEIAFKNSQTKHAELQTGACATIGGKVKEDCEFTAETVTLKKKVEVKK